ncbi:hypothetical protein BDZ97DRAFT_1829217 [Flammula alnicola]|nr:hypothetical protein BDZ97DRAFT_1829217 [Flammula alnicola]
MLDNVQNLLITGGTFSAAGSNTRQREDTKLLAQNISLGAYHDADKRPDPPKCYPAPARPFYRRSWIGRRILKKRRIMWMYGPAEPAKPPSQSHRRDVRESWNISGLPVFSLGSALALPVSA